MTNQIIRDAVADANAVQSVAEERAKSMLIREFSPRIRSALASLINEGEVSTGSDQPGGYNPDADKDAVGATVPAGQSSEDLAQDGDGPEKIQEEDDLPVDDKEEEPVLEGEEEDDFEKEKDGEEYEAADVAGIQKGQDPDDADAGDEEEPVLEIVDDPADDSEIPPAVDEDDEEDHELAVDDEKPVDAITELRKRNHKLAKENKQLREAVGVLHGKFKKIDLFNAKLAYAFKLMTQPGLTRNQKRQIAENFDSAKSVRETHLIYKTLKSGMANPVSGSPKKVLGNRNVRSVISEATSPKNAGYNRMNELAGI
jgi:hypothetical protein